MLHCSSTITGRTYAFFVGLFLLCIAPSFGAETFRVTFLVDSSEQMKVHDLHQRTFEPVQSKNLNLGFFRGVVWLKIETDALPDGSILELKNANLDDILFYEVKEGAFIKQNKTGDHFLFDTRSQAHRYYQWKVASHGTYLVRIKNYGDQCIVPIRLWGKPALSKRDRNENLLFGGYFGLLIFSLMLNLFLFAKMKEQITRYYLLYLVTLLFLQGALTGLSYEYLYPGISYFAQIAPPLFASLSVASLVKFTQHFLMTRQISIRLDGLFRIIFWLVLFNGVLALFSFSYWFSVVFVNVITLLLNVIIVPVGVIAWRNKVRNAGYFLLAFSVLIVAVFGFVLRNFGVLQSNLLTDNFLVIGSAFEITLLTLAIVDRFKAFRDEANARLKELNKVQREQNKMLEEKVQKRTKQLEVQSQKLETAHREILDSINYAKEIQSALIIPEPKLNEILGESFCLWMPKDIVSGDFYWGARVNDVRSSGEPMELHILCVGDCTGHGVPGAILSVLGLKLLNLSLNNKDVNSPGDALNFLNKEFQSTFRNKYISRGIQDGMDVGFCAIDFQTRKLYFSGAKLPLLIVRKGEVVEIKADRFSIGSTSEEKVFTENELDLEPGDMLYLTTDGFADQFGGANDKKFKRSKLKSLLSEIAMDDVSEQREYLRTEFNRWKGATEQTDDVCVVGLRIPF